MKRQGRYRAAVRRILLYEAWIIACLGLNMMFTCIQANANNGLWLIGIAAVGTPYIAWKGGLLLFTMHYDLILLRQVEEGIDFMEVKNSGRIAPHLARGRLR